MVFILWGQGPQICNAPARVFPYCILMAAPQLSFSTTSVQAQLQAQLVAMPPHTCKSQVT